jgi:hypothetical protein
LKRVHDLKPNEYTKLEDTSTSEVLNMVLGYDDDEVLTGSARLKQKVKRRREGSDSEVLGRMPVGGAGDVSEFDLMPPDSINQTESDDTYPSIFDAPPEDESETVMGSAKLRKKSAFRSKGAAFRGEDAPAPFKSLSYVGAAFPRLATALQKHRALEPLSRTVRVDTDETFGSLVADHGVKELERRISELRAIVEEHMADHHGAEVSQLRQWDEIVGAAKLADDLSAAKDTGDAVDALPAVPLDLPDFAEKLVKAWRDGDTIVVSVRFGAPDGTPRVATMAARPTTDVEAVADGAMKAGMDPAVVLGALPDLVDRACAKRLVKDVAGAALKVQRRLDVLGMSHGKAEPLLLVGAAGTRAPLAALMDVQQRANAGDHQAKRELAKLEGCATSPGASVLGGLLKEARSRLHKAKKHAPAQVGKLTYAQRYAMTMDLL